ncbi:MAG TPA: hypothetical protein VGJ22_14730, partial [Anaerolineales bacterium]
MATLKSGNRLPQSSSRSTRAGKGIPSAAIAARPAGNVRRAPMPSFFGALAALVQKDLTAEYRSRELLTAMLIFSILVIFIFNFALELDIQT